MRNIKYKEPSNLLKSLSTPDDISLKRSSIGNNKNIGEYYYININDIIAFRGQSRKIFEEGDLIELSNSIKKYGILQPLTVTISDVDLHKYEVVSGERRLRAAKLVGLDKVPCIVLSNIKELTRLRL